VSDPQTDTPTDTEVEEIPDFDSILDQVKADMEEEPESVDESEESDEDLSLEDQEEAEDDDTEEVDDDQEPDQDPDEEEESEEDDSDAEPEEEAKDEPERDELAELRQALQEQQKFNHQLVDKLKQHDSVLQEGQKQKQQEQQQQEPQKRPLETEQLEEGFRLQLFGSMEDREVYEALPPPIKKKAKEAVRRHSHEETLNILYPERRYESQIRYFVQQDIKKALGGLTEDYHARRAKKAFAQYEDQVKSPEDRKRLLEVMPTIPGYESDDWKTQETVLKLAVDQVTKERRLEGLAERERDLEIRESQVRNSRSNRSSPKGKRGQRRSQPKQRKLSAGDDLVEFARQLEQDINNGR